MKVLPAPAHRNPISKIRGTAINLRLNPLCAITAGLLLPGLLLLSTLARADSNATVTGLVTDSSGRAVAGVSIVFTNVSSKVAKSTETNREGIYRLPGLAPGVYRANLTKDGFSSVVKGDIELHVQDEVSINFALRTGSVFESITLEDGAPPVSPELAAVSTVVGRQFADSLPVNGRSFQTLIGLTPGVVLTESSPLDSGQFSVNGQRASSNYWTVDGVSANTGISATVLVGDGAAGGLPLFTAQGGTNSLVALDAMREFRIETSTAPAEFGRTPGAQISIVTRSGTNRFHGSLFDYFRNDVLDANDWFAHRDGLPKPEERQNDFGGTLGGPIVKERTFFFFSYEGLRLRLPQSSFTAVPDDLSVVGGIGTRESGLNTQPYLNAFPLPNGPEIFKACNPTTDPKCPPNGMKATGAAYFSASFSDRSSLDAYSLRVDHTLSRTLNVFGRYSYSPSDLVQREPQALSTVFTSRITAQSMTAGATWSPSPTVANDLRFNYSRTSASSVFSLDEFGGAVPLTAPAPPDPLSRPGSLLILDVFTPTIFLAQGKNERNLQQQFNLVDALSVQTGRHGLKVGIDIRRLTPLLDPNPYMQEIFFSDTPSLAQGNLFFGRVETHSGGTLLFRNLGFYAYDKWRVIPRLTLTYGVRWDIDFAPSSLRGPNLAVVTGFNLSDLSQLELAPVGTPPFITRYGNFAPRVGVAYLLGQSQRFQTVIRGGAGVFYDLATSEVGNNVGISDYPFGASKFLTSGSFPLSSADASPPSISASSLANGRLSALDPHLNLPYTVEWNASVEQAMGQEQTISATYVGAAGRRLLQTALLIFANPQFRQMSLVTNSASSDYHAFQLQYDRRLNRGLQALGSYTWSRSIDDASAGSAFGNAANALVPGILGSANRGSSDFDVRHALSAGLTYNVSIRAQPGFAKGVLQGWSLQSIVQARSAPPVNIYIPDLSDLTAHTQIRPDAAPGVPLYLYGNQYPGGRAINGTPGAVAAGCSDGSASIGPFCPPPTDGNGRPLRQGNLGRNALRAFGAVQWDFAVHREFQLRESLSLQFRAELFNLLNHPNFGVPFPLLTFSSTPPPGLPQFGRATELLGRALNGGNLTGGGLDPLYQFGGPRSTQLALKLVF